MKSYSCATVDCFSLSRWICFLSLRGSRWCGAVVCFSSTFFVSSSVIVTAVRNLYCGGSRPAFSYSQRWSRVEGGITFAVEVAHSGTDLIRSGGFSL